MGMLKYIIKSIFSANCDVNELGFGEVDMNRYYYRI